MISISTLTNRFFGVPAVDLKHYPINAHFSEAADFIDSVIKGKGSYHSASSEDAHQSCERERFLIDRELMSKLPLSNPLRRRPSPANSGCVLVHCVQGIRYTRPLWLFGCLQE